MKLIISDSNSILEKFYHQQWDDHFWQKLRLEALLLQEEDQDDELRVLDQLRGQIQTFPHQIKTAIKVKKIMKNRAILADEVGLGKTVEAGIIIKENICRGLVEKALILTPPSLVFQWKEEMFYKFSEKFIVASPLDTDYKDLNLHEKLIVSLDTAKLGLNGERLKEISWDILVIDEAHRLKNRRSLSYKFVKELQSKYLLLLTATPLQNNLEELYNLINLIQPGLLGTWRDFKKEYVADRKGREIKDHVKLQGILSQLMIRTTKRETENYLTFTKRIPHILRIQPTEEERRLYKNITQYVRRSYFNALHSAVRDEFKILSLMMLQRQVASSSAAVVGALQRKMQKTPYQSDILELSGLLNQALSISEDSKLYHLQKIIGELDSKIIVFTSFINTQRRIARILCESGVGHAIYSGEMSYRERSEAVRRFRERGRVLVCTEAGSEGMNLQFCNTVINYDLPWNPMKVEQRIGRVHRIGQERNVHIYNFVVEDTIEDYILRVLYEKIRLFELTIGDLELILEDDIENYERRLFDTYMMSLDHKDFQNRLGILRDQTMKRKNMIDDILEFDQRVFENFDLTPLNLIGMNTM